MNGIKHANMENLASTLIIKGSGYGHFHISIEKDGKELSATTTNATAIDAIAGDHYGDGLFYETKQEAEEQLIAYILHINSIGV